ncbi:MAG TPA: dihydrolipoamide acetyltransferase family protein [Ktedonobacteraceae bacterium]|nr:dihydrolipoamide acetyltransferase family protein [Ktedonobacteraceae bacterium]
MQEFKLPDLGEGMQEAEIRRWLVKPDDTVKLDQPMVEVETDKAVIEIPSPVAGHVTEIRVPEGKTAHLGEVLIAFTSLSENTTLSVQAPRSVVSAADSSDATQQKSAAPSAAQQRVLAAPAVRKRAFELGIDLAKVMSSQPHGRITMDDLLAYTQQSAQPLIEQPPEPMHLSSNGVNAATPSPTSGFTVPTTEMLEERVPLTGLRRKIAEHMERSWRTIPHTCSFDEIDGTELVTLRQALLPVAQRRDIRLTYLPILIKLLLPLLKEFPIFNASFDEERREIIYKRAYHLGIAVDTPEGLLVPVLRNADQLTLYQIAQQLEYLVEGARKRTLTISELSGSTFTLNNLGSFGGSNGTPIINYPEVAILVVGRLQEKAVVHNETLVARTMLPLTLAFDHRLIDGALSRRFLARFKELVEHPQQIMLDMV